ncbi:glycosyltransferase family 4 protein [Shewanella sp. SM74]|uniref:glycosyltransferase family 4 protein n=1 Tax=Shewanella sp. SM74 TaxID=2912807 RepID=UPI0021DB38A1|nr:glycosyltransferase family 4 protein [Shewanella sp. SM74]MCU8011273.1 glycosyltransferase family 4 protein [Shewanella sp. SM74]
MTLKLVIVATHTTETRGGISSALAGYEAGFRELNVEFIRVNSHSDQRGRVSQWLLAGWQILRLAMKYRSNAVFWFHCGPWLSMSRKFTFALVARAFGAKTIAHLHSPAISDYLNTAIGRFGVKLFSLPFEQFIVLTPWWREKVLASGLKKPINICPNPVTPELLSHARKYCFHAPELPKVSESIVILAMARLLPEKGIQHVLAALDLLPEQFQLVIAGDGPLKVSLEKQVDLLGLQHRVTFTGWLETKVKIEILNKADLFCLPSLYDSFGMVFIEAMAFNLPIVACDWGPIADVVTSEVGLLVPYANPESVASAVTEIVKNPFYFSVHGAESVVKKYSPKACAEKVVALL